MTKGQNESGAILVAVLLVLTLLAGIAAALVHSGRNALLTLRAEDALLRRENALHSALASLGGVLSPPLSAGQRDGRSFTLPSPADAVVTAKVQAISGLVNANTAPTVLIEGLLRAAGADDLTAQDKAAALGAARQQTPFRSADELAIFFADTPAIWQQVRPVLTVWGKADTLDPDTAPRLALLAIPGMTTGAADALIATRATAVWAVTGRAEAELLYRPFLAGQDQGIYGFSLRVGADRLASTGIGMLDKDGRFHLIGLDWPSAEENIAP
jgi:general secretion pathway protein K